MLSNEVRLCNIANKKSHSVKKMFFEAIFDESTVKYGLVQSSQSQFSCVLSAYTVAGIFSFL